jgi:RNA polymerase sigma-70 factor (ECF subfamily)
MQLELSHIIQKCVEQDKAAQQSLFESYKGILFAICKRYINLEIEAEDVFIEGFYKIFNKIEQYNGDGSFEGWMKRIMVNESLMHLRSKKMLMVELEIQNISAHEDSNIVDQLDAELIMIALEQLPLGYRTIFNLYVVEGYKHREIAEELNISIHTSKSQLILAKKRLQEILKKNLNLNTSYGT